MAKHLISLIDGTSVSAAFRGYDGYSNIFALACLVQIHERDKRGWPQVVFYSSGISSQPDTSNTLNKITGNSIRSQIVDQYTNICANYDFKRRQDRIYLFGYSRGAMAVRALAGLIAEFGLLPPNDIRHLPELLRAWNASEGMGGLKPGVQQRLVPVEIEFVGVFDSVMGGIESLPLFHPIRFSNHDLPEICRTGVQFLAIDEDRPHFRPKLWTRHAKPAARAQPGYFRQIWMPGVHSDVGGTGGTLLGRASLLGMIHYILQSTSLAIDADAVAREERLYRWERHSNNLWLRPNRRISANGVFPRSIMRVPVGAAEMQESYHPICERIGQCRYKRRRRQYAWNTEVFETRIRNRVPLNGELSAYFANLD